MTPAITVDERARVPFALVGVLLVVTSATYVTTLQREQPETRPAVDVVMERTVADARAALREAVAKAGVRAASDPVVTPAETPYGEVLSSDRPFRDWLRTRIYLAAIEQFRAVEHHRRGVETTVSIPDVTSPETLETAIDRVDIAQTGQDGTALRVSLAGVNVTATRDGRVVGRRSLSFDVEVETPVLATHERVETFVERLEADLDEPGLTQQVTSELYAVAWARGYAQYSGAPIQNVVGNRHLEVLTNGALLDIQRSVFGRSDADGRRAHGLAIARVGIRDAAGPALRDYPALGELTKQTLRVATKPTEDVGAPEPLARPGEHAPRPNDTMSVTVGRSVDVAFARFYDDLVVATAHRRNLDAVNDTIRSVYSARVRSIAATERIERARLPDPEPPGPDWTHERTTSSRSVVDVSNATGGGPSVASPAGYHTLKRYTHVVTVERTRTAHWRRNGTVNTTRTTDTGRVRVAVELVGAHAKSAHAPPVGIRTVHVPGGPVDGPNLANVTDRAVREVVDDSGGSATLARRVVNGRLSDDADLIRGDVPDALYDWLYLDLASFRETLRNVSTQVERAKLGTFEATPAADLAARLERNRSRLVGVPDAYPAVASKARIAVRSQYLDAVVQALERRATERVWRAGKVDNRLQDRSALTLGTVRDGLDARQGNEREPGRGNDGPALHYRVDGAPPYLTISGLTHEQVPAIEPGETVYPLTARNQNLGTIPYSDVVDGIVEAVSGKPKTSLGTAGKALRAANRTLAATQNETLARQRIALGSEIEASLAALRLQYDRMLAAHGVGRDARREILDDAFGRWQTVHGRALAADDGSIARAVASVAKRRAPEAFDSTRSVDELTFRLREGTHVALDGRAQVAGPAVERTASLVSEVAKAEIEGAVGDGIDSKGVERLRERWGKNAALVPAGIPITPVPGYWYATMNLWTATVRGAYERFAVEAPRGTAAVGDSDLQYVRDGSNVTLDVNGDGRAERFGRATRVGFEVRASVVVVVPPYRSGVGDVDGKMIEESPGWGSKAPTGWVEKAGRIAGNVTEGLTRRYSDSADTGANRTAVSRPTGPMLDRDPRDSAPAM